MNPQRITTARLANGLVVAVEEMPDVESAAYSLLLPAGSAWEQAGVNGTAAVLTELMPRGAGGLDNRAFNARFDELGIQAHESTSTAHVVMGGACLAKNLQPALELTASMVREPHLPEDEFEPAWSRLEQELLALEDEPRERVMVGLRRQAYGEPWGRAADGRLDELEHVTYETVREQYRRCIHPDGAVLGIAGRIRADEVLAAAEKLWGSWTATTETWPVLKTPEPTMVHETHDSAQTQIGVAYPSVCYADDDYYAAWAAVNVLSGGMSSRLFSEVREKRGLCYSVYATLHSHPTAGRVLCYVGSTNHRAQEALDVLIQELKRLGDGISDDELSRCKARAKSALIMSQESTSSRASSLARDWFHLGRITSLHEVRARIESLTPTMVMDYVRRWPARSFSVLTIGPQPLEKTW